VTIVRGENVPAPPTASVTVSSPVATVDETVATVATGVDGAGAEDDSIWRCDYCTMVPAAALCLLLLLYYTQA